MADKSLKANTEFNTEMLKRCIRLKRKCGHKEWTANCPACDERSSKMAAILKALLLPLARDV